jgi:GNAT superfamily N-acetyltransferase
MIEIRLAQPEDIERITVLCEQLGYPSSQEQVRQRLHRIRQRGDHAVYVAEQADGRVLGWVHVFVRQLLVTDLHVEIGGLVVDEEHHRRGIGQLLMEQAEQWAREKGRQAVYVRSNVIREGAHAFYERIGYTNIKHSKVFRKIL